MRGAGEPVLKPRGLRAGSRLALVSPASAARPERVLQGAGRLEAMGYQTTIMPHALCSGPLYYAGTAEQRASDLHAAFADPAVDGIVCTRGGWGSAELLPLLDRELIAAHPKPFLGYSDQTSLHLWLWRETRMVTFHGPMAAADFAGEEAVDTASWERSLAQEEPWSLGAADGMRVLRPGEAEGRLLGGCLALVAESLGTAYAPVWDEPYLLFLEDIHVRPFQWDRMLLHLRYAGLLDGARGIVLGDMTQSAPAEEQPALEQAMLHTLRDFDGPVAIGLRSGHVEGGNITLPLGVRARLSAATGEEPRLRLLESAVVV